MERGARILALNGGSSSVRFAIYEAGETPLRGLRGKIDRIVSVVTEVAGVKLLDVDPNGDYNRCVITYAGEPAACE